MKKTVSMLAGILFCLQVSAQGVQVGPWVSEARDNRLTIQWTSEKAGMAYVELQDGSCLWETFAGRRIFQRLHAVTLEGLTPGQVVRYRVCGVNLKDDSNARNPKFGETYEGEWHSIRTLDPAAATCRFSVFNDIHMRTAKYTALASQVDSAATDFLFLNGDIVSAGNYELDTLVHYAIRPLGNLTAGLPLLFARGNHEGRGNNVKLVADVFRNSSPAPFYYTFRQGPVAFIVFDAGETGKQRSILYSGKDVYEEYLQEQMEWAPKAMAEPEFRDAPVKVCLLHVPMIDHEDKGDYLLQRWLNIHVLPLLNQAGVNLMIGADLHEPMFCDTGTMGNDFPIIVNDDARRLDFSYADGVIIVKTFNAEGEKESERSFTLVF